MKKAIIGIFLVATLLCAMLAPVSAQHYWNDSMKFTAAYGTITVDGKVDAGEWDDAAAIDMKLNNDALAAKGNVNYQGAWETERNDSDYMGTYKIKWDDNYIYFLEIRKDDVVNLAGNGVEPYLTDGVLIFTQVDSADGSLNPTGVSHHIFYSVGKEGAIGGDVQVRICDTDAASRETVAIDGAKIASAKTSDGYIEEIAVPWATYQKQVAAFKPAAGQIMGLSYVVHDSDATDGTTGFVKQFCYAIDNENLGDVPNGYDFGSWGTLELLAAPAPAPTEAEAAPAPDAAAGDDAPAPAPAKANPTTGDETVVFIALAVLAAAGILTARKIRVK